MENQRTEYIPKPMTMNDQKVVVQSQRNGPITSEILRPRVGTLELKVPRTRDGEFAPTVFERYHVEMKRHRSLPC